MAALSDNIERFIKELLQEDTRIELKRNELAQYFGCANSQINYVLATRFSMDRGYLVESRRGGSGYVRLIRLSTPSADLYESLMERIGDAVDEETAFALISRLRELKLVTAREERLMRSCVCAGAAALPLGCKDALRACVLKSAITQVFKELEEEN